MWLVHLDFKHVEKKLNKLIKNAKTLKQLVALQVLLIQLKNGSRISESLEAYYKFIQSGKREVYVRVRKQRKNRYRLIVIPSNVKRIDVKITKRYVQYVCRKLLNCNTHSLRYAYITYLSKLNIPFQLISKITKHREPSMIQHYTNEILAVEIQKKIAK